MAELADLAAPLVHAPTCLHHNQALRLRGQKVQYFPPGQLLPKHDRPVRARVVELKPLFRQVDADNVHLFHGFSSCRAVNNALLP